MSKKLVELYFPPEESDGYILSPKKTFRLAIIAPSNSGKSFLITSLLLSDHPFLRKAFYKCVFIDPTFFSSNQKNPYKYLNIPEENVYEEPSDDVISSIFSNAPRNPNTNEVLPSLVVLDDTGEIKRNNLLNKFWIKARHYGISLIGSFQKLTFLSKPIRQSLSHIILFKSQNKSMINEFCDEFMDFDRETNYAIIKYATTPDAENPRPFLFIDLEKKKYYKCFDTEIKVKDIFYNIENDKNITDDEEDNNKDKSSENTA